MSHPLALPKTFSPDALDTTAELASILARLQPPQSASGEGEQPSTENTTLGGPMAGTPITLRDLPTATDSIKHKLKHARVQIKTLPDMGRTVAAQETEMRQLEARIEAQKAMLAKLRAEGARFAGKEL
ncbi:microtubule-associated protein [Ophiostoma piceae UAMH 11346]|uniref:Mediator of RNA polymerase II transcription subunit 9 n=1 Tax=Ophiostoma piceae (strain UAMH 11346) TaxID=1262450 RepID=S3C864_OPHP1|nr:microtubule-associated protein [Ophiostoma piceae UAMH 11346]